jgi:hypothetical protein
LIREAAQEAASSADSGLWPTTDCRSRSREDVSSEQANEIFRRADAAISLPQRRRPETDRRYLVDSETLVSKPISKIKHNGLRHAK